MSANVCVLMSWATESFAMHIFVLANNSITIYITIHILVVVHCNYYLSWFKFSQPDGNTKSAKFCTKNKNSCFMV